MIGKQIPIASVESKVIFNINDYCSDECMTCGYDSNPCDGCVIYETKCKFVDAD